VLAQPVAKWFELERGWLMPEQILGQTTEDVVIAGRTQTPEECDQVLELVFCRSLEESPFFLGNKWKGIFEYNREVVLHITCCRDRYAKSFGSTLMKRADLHLKQTIDK
jgi:hypothetical protein